MDNKKYGYIKTLDAVKIPAIYKHFKNKLYATMGFSRPISTVDVMEYKDKLGIEIYEIEHMEVFHTEMNDLMISFNIEGEWRHISNVTDKNLVLYKSLYDDFKPYARPIDMFLSYVDKEKYPDVEQKYRFELFEY